MIFAVAAGIAALSVVPLTSNSPAQGSLAGGESAVYSVSVPAHRAVVVSVEQRGVDVTLALHASAGDQSLQDSSMNAGTVGREVLVVPISPAPASWTVVVKAALPRAPRGEYAITAIEGADDERARGRADLYARFHQANTRGRNKGVDLQQSVEELGAVTDAAANLGDDALAGEAHYQTGLLLDLLDEPPRAIMAIERALAIFRDTGARGREARALNRLGDLSRIIGEPVAAERYFASALPLAREVRDLENEADILNNSGLLASSLGRKDEAISALLAAVPIAQEIESRDVEAALHHNIGQAYMHLGDFERSIDAYERSLAVKRRIGSPRRLANTLNSIGVVRFAMGDTEGAMKSVREAIELWETAGAKTGKAISLIALGRMLHAAGDVDAARASFAAALPPFQEALDRIGETQLLASWAQLDMENGDLAAALEKVEGALELARAAGDRRHEARALFMRAQVLRAGGRLDDAIESIAAAVAVVEEARSAIARPDLRSSYLAVVRSYYDLYVELLLESDSAANRDRAFAVSERARARALLEGLAENAARITKGVDPALLKREREVQATLNAKAAYRRQVAERGKASEEAAVTKEIEDLIEQWRLVQAEIRRASPEYAALKMPETITVERVRESLLDDRTALIEYHLGDDSSRAWVIDSRATTVHTLPRRPEIERLAREWHALLSSDRRGRTEDERTRTARELSAAGTRLAAAILEPLSSRLKTKRLVIVPDGALHYVPFAALPIGSSGDPMVTRFEIAHLPSASVLETLRGRTRGRHARRAVAVFADPVFSRDDPRLASTGAPAVASGPVTRDEERRLPGGFLPRLRFSRLEAEAIAGAADGATFEALDFEASKQTLLRRRWRDYGIIHFATHGALNTHHPELSGLVLSLVDPKGRRVDGFLRLHEIYNLDLDSDVVVLSACETALGKEIHGEGLIGLTRGFMYAGASRVVSTTWKVEDRATARLMSHFYRQMFEKDAGPAAALREAQLAMFRQSRWSDPHYWAGFALAGDWR